MKIKTHNLEGIALDWTVARIAFPNWMDEGYMKGCPDTDLVMDDGEDFSPSTDREQAFRLAEDSRIAILPEYDVGTTESGKDYQEFIGWKAYRTDMAYWRTAEIFRGPNPMVAAMRCYVDMYAGKEVEVPDSLLVPKNAEHLAPQG
jgi:hypothetical protein